MPSVGPVWEYASVSSYATGVDAADICYAIPSGVCRYNHVTTSAGGQRQGAEAVMWAAATLGEKGWELTSVTDGSKGRVMYFKRLRSVLNRSDSASDR
jgi:hypothetical protein